MLSAKQNANDVSPLVSHAMSAASCLEAKRLHFQHGPIDLIIDLMGDPEALKQAQACGQTRFDNILNELVSELAQLRRQVSSTNCLKGAIARRMWQATSQVGSQFITPMAAVAGAVADEMLACMSQVPGITRLCINNGGDIAFWGADEERFRIGLVTDLVSTVLHKNIPAIVEINGSQHIHGVATSGWRGRSHSLGVADAVTVFANNAASADAAATMIANATNVASERISRQPAIELNPDSDLGEKLVTVNVESLTRTEINHALNEGAILAEQLLYNSTIAAAILVLQGEYLSVGDI